MSIRISTENPSELLSKIKKAIDDLEIETWTYDDDGDFTHTPEQWDREAWLRPAVEETCLLLNIMGRADQVMTKAVYGVYHGRFIEMVLTHFDEDCSSLVTTSLFDLEDLAGFVET